MCVCSVASRVDIQPFVVVGRLQTDRLVNERKQIAVEKKVHESECENEQMKYRHRLQSILSERQFEFFSFYCLDRMSGILLIEFRDGPFTLTVHRPCRMQRDDRLDLLMVCEFGQ